MVRVITEEAPTIRETAELTAEALPVITATKVQSGTKIKFLRLLWTLHM